VTTTMTQAMAKEGTDNSAETKPPASWSWSWLWFRPIELEGLSPTERQIVRRTAGIIPRQFGYIALMLGLLSLFLSAVALCVSVSLVKGLGPLEITLAYVPLCVYAIFLYWALAVQYQFRLQGILKTMGVCICSSCGQRAETLALTHCRDCGAEHKEHSMQVALLLGRPWLRAALSQCSSEDQKSALWKTSWPSWRRWADWIWIVGSLIFIGLVSLLIVRVIAIGSLRESPYEVAGFVGFVAALVFFVIFVMSVVNEVRMRMTLARAGIRICPRCLNRAHSEGQANCEVCHVEFSTMKLGPLLWCIGLSLLVGLLVSFLR